MDIAARPLQKEERPEEEGRNVEGLGERKARLERTISIISTRFANAVDFDQAVNESLRDMGELGGASRAYLFLFREGDEVMDNTHEWCAPGVSRQMENLQNLPFSAAPWWVARLRQGEVIHIENVNEMPIEAASEKELLLMQDIKAVLCLPVTVSQRVVGFIGFDNVEKAEDWSTENLVMLRLFAEILGSALSRHWSVQALREAELERERSLTRFIQTAAHELRNPMGGIKGLITLLRLEAEGGKTGENILEIVDLMEREVDRLSTLMNQLLEAFRVQEGHLSLDRSPVDLVTLVKTVTRMFQTIKGDRFLLNIQEGKRFCVRGDATRLEEVFRNLLGNAVKYSANRSDISISLQEGEGGTVLFAVQDQGFGIPKEQIDKIFRPFYRASNLAGRDPGGFGLGLYVCRSIVQRHGGRIWADSVEGEGSTFYVELPVNSE